MHFGDDCVHQQKAALVCEFQIVVDEYREILLVSVLFLVDDDLQSILDGFLGFFNGRAKNFTLFKGNDHFVERK